MIQIVGPQLSQWDTGRSVQITGYEVEYAHFANKGDSKAVIMGVVDIDAKIPDYLLQTGKELCVYAVKDGITLESKTFSVKKRERPENYVYEDDQRNYIYELVTSAENAVEEANNAAENAKQATANADKATASASVAAESANVATANANTAADSANKAAIEVSNTAKNFMVIGQAEGENIALDNAIDQFFVGCRIFGKTTQDGTPTPDAPVELVSVGDSGSITVNVAGDNDAQSMTIATPNGLPGIPVKSGGNYTDANGQQWTCDEKDYSKGVYIQRVRKVTALDFSSGGYGEVGNYSRTGLWIADAKYSGSNTTASGLSNIMLSFGNYTADQLHFYVQGRQLWVFVPINELAEKTTEGVMAWMRSKDAEFQYILETPIETPLSDEELAAYASLHTYRGNTTISNDASAHMEIEYVMDAKKYIDSLVKAPSAWLSNVTLLASKWAGSNGLYSQVVTISGITEYSKVDLLPSVEQLAIFFNKNVAFVTENEDGVVTVYAIGDKPTLDYTMQAQITEVVA